MSNDKVKAAGYENVRPHQGWEQLAAWGRTGEIPPPDDVLEGYQSPGVPPWESQVHQDLGVQHGWPTPGSKRPLPTWVWVLFVSVAVLFCSFLVWTATLPPATSPVRPLPAAPALPQNVQVTGKCEKQIIGHYGLIASVTATNPSDHAQTGTVWVRWPVTGEEDRTFVKTFTIPAGGSADFHVNQPVETDVWYRTGQCSYSWTAS